MSDESVMMLLYLTARISALLFLGAFVGESLRALVPGPVARALGDHRRGLMLAFVAMHTIHLGVIGIAAARPGGERFLETWPFTIVLGGIVYALVFALGWGALSSGPSPRLPPRFELVAEVVVWGAFTRPLATRMVTHRTPLHMAFAVAFLSAMALRIIAARRAAPAPA